MNFLQKNINKSGNVTFLYITFYFEGNIKKLVNPKEFDKFF
jgi:hypothetical protein